MARRPSLKPQLNQIRTWVGEGVTDIWIAHQLDATPLEVGDFRRKHGLLRPDETPAAAPTKTPRTRKPAEPKPKPARPARAKAAPKAAAASTTDEPTADDVADDDGTAPAKRRRRGRRGGRGRSKGRQTIPATIEHTEDGVVIRIDAAVLESPAYREHWAAVASGGVTVTPTGLTISTTAASDDEDDAEDAPGPDDEATPPA